MQNSPAAGPSRLAGGAGVLVTALQIKKGKILSYKLAADTTFSQDLQCGLPAGPVLLWRERNSAYALKQTGSLTMFCVSCTSS